MSKLSWRIRQSGRRALVRISGVGLVWMLVGCNWGMRPEKFAPAQTAAGARVAVRVTNESSDRHGELLSADRTGIILRTDDGRLVHIAWPRLAAMDVAEVGADFDIQYGEQPDSAKQNRLALVSRFPQGLSGPLLARALDLLHQPALEEIK